MEQSQQQFQWYYVFSAKSLQRYILHGNKLQLMIGASNLVERIPTELIPAMLETMNLAENRDFRILSSTAGSIRILFASEDSARHLAEIVPLVMNQYAPGLEFVQHYQKMKDSILDTMQEGEQAIQIRRNIRFPQYPLPGPLVKRNPRSGLAAVGMAYFGTDTEWMDAVSQAKKKAASDSTDILMKKIFPEDFSNGEQNPVLELEKLIENEGDYIAILHADANNM